MEETELLRSLEELMELEVGTLTGEEKLEDLAGWSSLAVIGFIALADEHGRTVSPTVISKCNTVNDLIRLVVDKSAQQTA